jgi:putative oligomerization/nucleic acid binding protein
MVPAGESPGISRDMREDRTMEEGTGSAASKIGDPRIAQAMKDLETMLIPGERLEAFAVQRRLFAMGHRRRIVIATSGRLIAMTRRLFGGFDPEDVRWQDVRDVHLHVGIFGADLTVAAYGSPDLAIGGNATRTIALQGLGKEGAQSVYRNCQAQEQAWREKRRIRELEEMRARAGGIQLGALGTPAPVTSPGGNGSDSSPTARLQRAKDMRESGLLTDAEFEQIKAKILSEL